MVNKKSSTWYKYASPQTKSFKTSQIYAMRTEIKYARNELEHVYNTIILGRP